MHGSQKYEKKRTLFGTPLIYLPHHTRVNCSVINIVDVGEDGCARVCMSSVVLIMTIVLRYLRFDSRTNIVSNLPVTSDLKLSKLFWNFWKSIAPFSPHRVPHSLFFEARKKWQIGMLTTYVENEIKHICSVPIKWNKIKNSSNKTSNSQRLWASASVSVPEVAAMKFNWKSCRNKLQIYE